MTPPAITPTPPTSTPQSGLWAGPEDLLERLRALAAGAHDDLSVADEAADYIEELCLHYADLEIQYSALYEALSDAPL
jgi:hypothetical protein